MPKCIKLRHSKPQLRHSDAPRHRLGRADFRVVKLADIVEAGASFHQDVLHGARAQWFCDRQQNRKRAHRVTAATGRPLLKQSHRGGKCRVHRDASDTRYAPRLVTERVDGAGFAHIAGVSICTGRTWHARRALRIQYAIGALLTRWAIFQAASMPRSRPCDEGRMSDGTRLADGPGALVLSVRALGTRGASGR